MYVSVLKILKCEYKLAHSLDKQKLLYCKGSRSGMELGTHIVRLFINLH